MTHLKDKNWLYKKVCLIGAGRFGLYPVITEKFCAGRSSVEVLKAIIHSGLVNIVQLREKEKSRKEIYEMALVFRRLTAAHKMIFIVNDYVDIALTVGADGVHLGQEDIPISVARRLANNFGRKKFLIGASTHSLEEAIKAQREGADYVNIGPIFPTKTKEINAIKPLGIESIERIAPNLKVPFTVMGGIKEENITLPASKGARIFAMVTEITSTPDIIAKIKTLASRLEN